MSNDKTKAIPSETISPENRGFTEMVESGKYGKILKDPQTGDVAVIFKEGKTIKLSAEEIRTSKPEYGSVVAKE